MTIWTLMAGAIVAAAGSAAVAGTTSFNINIGGGREPSLKTIFGTIYGGTFNRVSPGSANYTNGGVMLTRVQDFISSVSATGPQRLDGSTLGAADDNSWADGPATVRFEAKYAANANTLGWYNNSANGSVFQPLLGSAPGSTVTTTLSNNFEWGLRSVGSSTTSFWRSNRFSNSGSEDHMVSYLVTGLAGGPRWLLAWEDVTLEKSDMDYNDWVGEVGMTIAPLPASGWAALAGLAGVIGLRMRRRRG